MLKKALLGFVIIEALVERWFHCRIAQDYLLGVRFTFVFKGLA